MRERARQLIFKYVKDHRTTCSRTWATERPFELYLDGVVVSGRADVIYDEHDGVIDNLAIVDYKTATRARSTPCNCRSTPMPADAKGSPSGPPSSTTWARQRDTTLLSMTPRSGELRRSSSRPQSS